MFKSLMAATCLLAFMPSAFAGALDLQATANSTSGANADSASQAVAYSQGGNVTFNTPANQHITQSGTTTIRSAPQVVAPSMSSGHPCAYAPVSVGISVIGFGGAFGGQKIDDACLLAQMQVKNAAMIMIAQRNPAACRALEAAGNLGPGSCGGSRRTVAPVASPVAYRPNRNGATTIPRGSVTCVKNTKGKVIKIQRWPSVSDATARQYCRQ